MSSQSSTVLVTGGTGLLGVHIVDQLLAAGRPVRVFTRDPDRARRRLHHPVDLVEGDLTDPASVRDAVRGCGVVYHAGGLPEQWLPDPNTFFRVNREGTYHVLEAVRSEGIRRLVYTSSIDVFPAERGETFDEEAGLDPDPKPTPYEQSKLEADRLVAGAVGEGLDAVILHPAALYGPGPDTSPGLNQSILRLADGHMPALPPGSIPLVLAEDAARGHMLAESSAPSGRRLILCERLVSMRALAAVVRSQTGCRVPPVLPLPAARAAAWLMEAAARIIRRPPMLARGQLRFLQWGAEPSSRRAREELGWEPLPLEVGIRRLLETGIGAS